MINKKFQNRKQLVQSHSLITTWQSFQFKINKFHIKLKRALLKIKLENDRKKKLLWLHSRVLRTWKRCRGIGIEVIRESRRAKTGLVRDGLLLHRNIDLWCPPILWRPPPFSWEFSLPPLISGGGGGRGRRGV